VSRWEQFLVGVFIAAAVPFTLTLIGWWGSASLLMAGLLRVTDSQIVMAACLGLALGLVLDLVLLRRWIGGFYRVDLRLLLPLYLLWTAMATAFFMGLPLGNLLLGTVAGLYIGRRAVYAAMPDPDRRRLAGQASLFTAGTTSAAALGIGLLAAREPYTLAPFRRLLGLDQEAATIMVDLAIVAVAVVLIAASQFWLTRLSAAVTIRLVAER
jgi:hypothetical protein